MAAIQASWTRAPVTAATINKSRSSGQVPADSPSSDNEGESTQMSTWSSAAGFELGCSNNRGLVTTARNSPTHGHGSAQARPDSATSLITSLATSCTRSGCHRRTPGPAPTRRRRGTGATNPHRRCHHAGGKVALCAVARARPVAPSPGSTGPSCRLGAPWPQRLFQQCIGQLHRGLHMGNQICRPIHPPPSPHQVRALPEAGRIIGCTQRRL